MQIMKSRLLALSFVCLFVSSAFNCRQVSAQLLRSGVSRSTSSFSAGFAYGSPRSSLLRSPISIGYSNYNTGYRSPSYGFSGYGFRSGFGIGLSHRTSFYGSSRYYSTAYRPYYSSRIRRPYYGHFSTYAPRYAFYSASYPSFGFRYLSSYRSLYYPSPAAHFGYSPLAARHYYSPSYLYRPVYVYPSYAYVPRYPAVPRVSVYHPVDRYVAGGLSTTIFPLCASASAYNCFHSSPYTVTLSRPYYTYCQPAYPVSPLSMCPSCLVPGGVTPSESETTPRPEPLPPEPREDPVTPKAPEEPLPPEPGTGVNATLGPLLTPPSAN